LQLGGAADQIWAHLGAAPGVVRADLGTGLAVPRPETFQRVSKHIVDKRSFQAPCAQYQISELDGDRATPYLLARNLITAKRARNKPRLFTIIHFEPTANVHTSSSTSRARTRNPRWRHAFSTQGLHPPPRQWPTAGPNNPQRPDINPHLRHRSRISATQLACTFFLARFGCNAFPSHFLQYMVPCTFPAV
jgi:hypothetical protein